MSGTVGFLATYSYISDPRYPRSRDIPLSLLGGAATTFVGSATGYYISKRDQSGAIATASSTILGSTVGTLVPVLLIVYSEGGELLVDPGPWYLLPSIGGTAGFNLANNRYKSPPASEAALINFSDGQWHWNVPSRILRPGVSKNQVGLEYQTTLLHISF